MARQIFLTRKVQCIRQSYATFRIDLFYIATNLKIKKIRHLIHLCVSKICCWAEFSMQAKKLNKWTCYIGCKLQRLIFEYLSVFWLFGIACYRHFGVEIYGRFLIRFCSLFTFVIFLEKKFFIEWKFSSFLCLDSEFLP